MNDEKKRPSLTLRPYQALCVVCSLGEDSPMPRKGRLKDILRRIRENPDVPVTLQCNAGEVYMYQDPGIADDTPEGGEFNRKRDLDMLQILGLGYGSTMKAKDLYRLIFERIPTTRDVCRRQSLPPSVWWDGCGENNTKNPRGNESYEKGREMLKKEFGLV